jgi:hypothetical protein
LPEATQQKKERTMNTKTNRKLGGLKIKANVKAGAMWSHNHNRALKTV